MRTLYYNDEVTGTEAGASLSIPSIKGNPTGLVQFECSTGTVTGALQGRLSPDHAWVTIYEFDEDGGIQSVALMPYMRMNITAVTGDPEILVSIAGE